MTYDRKDIPAIADEYVLGLLGAADVNEVEVAMERDAELRAAIAASRERFLPLDMSVAPATVTEQLWQRIEAALPVQDQTGLMPLISNANDNRRNGWRMAAISAIAATFLLAIGLAYSLTRTVEPLVVAVLINDAGEVQAIVEDFGNEQATIRMLADFNIPGDKAIQVWTLPSRDRGQFPSASSMVCDRHVWLFRNCRRQEMISSMRSRWNRRADRRQGGRPDQYWPRASRSCCDNNRARYLRVVLVS